ncbi:hypothetical protein A1Q_3409 [Vibrio campbellii HY01]|nr:hypothetical protein A1Q_3409 [Vibrio campbellii HY01]
MIVNVPLSSVTERSLVAKDPNEVRVHSTNAIALWIRPI